MPLSPDIERDLADLEKKMKKQAKRRQLRGRGLWAAAVFWAAIAVGILCDRLDHTSLVYSFAALGAVTLGMVGLGLGAWTMVGLMNADLNGEL